MGSISLDLPFTINRFPVITVTKSTSDIAANKIIEVPAKVRIHPLTEISIGKGEGRTVDDFITVESHIVDFVIGRECERLLPDLQPNGSALCFGVEIPFIIVNIP